MLKTRQFNVIVVGKEIGTGDASGKTAKKLFYTGKTISTKF